MGGVYLGFQHDGDEVAQGTGQEGGLLVHPVDDALVRTEPIVTAEGKSSHCHHIQHLW